MLSIITKVIGPMHNNYNSDISRTINDLSFHKQYDQQLENKLFPTDNYNYQGQIKLHLIEIKYLLRIDQYLKNNSSLIIYIGAAPGTHLIELVKLYKNYDLIWHFYDPRPFEKDFDEDEYLKSRVTIFTGDAGFFTPTTAKQYENIQSTILKDRIIHIISDIRSSENNQEPSTKNLIQDYKIENETVKLVNPKTALLKWRYPFVDSNKQFQFERVQGVITEEWLQIFPKPKSTELRLYLEGPFDKPYRIINEQMCNNADELMFAYKMGGRFHRRNIEKYELNNSCYCNDCCLLSEVMTSFKNIHNKDLDLNSITNLLNRYYNLKNN
jgi:hypothetical protein